MDLEHKGKFEEDLAEGEELFVVDGLDAGLIHHGKVDL